ncbi:MAG: hypothetical protein HC896_04550 [Bacteroidales bacterium]|nr:hypothetical protein [Bacteroidales bacterium]
MVATLVNYYIDLPLVLMLTTIGGTILFSIYFICSRYFYKKRVIKWLMNLSLFVYFDVLWVYNYGSRGPIIFVFLVFYTFVVFIWDGRVRKVLVGLFGANILFLFFLEYSFPHIALDYPSETTGLLIFIQVFYYILAPLP